MNQIQFIGINPDQLKAEIVKDVTTSLLQSLAKEFTPKQPTEYLTRQEVAKMFQIDLSTVHNWTKQGKIQSYGMGGRVFYKRKELNDAIVSLNKNV